MGPLRVACNGRRIINGYRAFQEPRGTANARLGRRSAAEPQSLGAPSQAIRKVQRSGPINTNHAGSAASTRKITLFLKDVANPSLTGRCHSAKTEWARPPGERPQCFLLQHRAREASRSKRNRLSFWEHSSFLQPCAKTCNAVTSELSEALPQLSSAPIRSSRLVRRIDLGSPSTWIMAPTSLASSAVTTVRDPTESRFTARSFFTASAEGLNPCVLTLLRSLCSCLARLGLDPHPGLANRAARLTGRRRSYTKGIVRHPGSISHALRLLLDALNLHIMSMSSPPTVPTVSSFLPTPSRCF